MEIKGEKGRDRRWDLSVWPPDRNLSSSLECHVFSCSCGQSNLSLASALVTTSSNSSNALSSSEERSEAAHSVSISPEAREPASLASLWRIAGVRFSSEGGDSAILGEREREEWSWGRRDLPLLKDSEPRAEHTDRMWFVVLTLSVLEGSNSVLFPKALQTIVMRIIFRDYLCTGWQASSNRHIRHDLLFIIFYFIFN